MEKCWFVLPQTHFPPPQQKDQNGLIKQTGPLCLGHFVQDLSHLDQVINTGGPEPFPLDMPIYQSRPIEFALDSEKTCGMEISTAATVPLPVAAGLTVKGSLGLSLRKTTRECWKIEALETMTVQPTRSYINKCLASELIAEYIKHHKRGPKWSIFMITGLKVVRGNSSRETTRGQERGISAGSGVGIPTIIDASLSSDLRSGKTMSVSESHCNDFVWAVRLSKITRGLFDSKWSQKTFSRGATFDLSGRRDETEAFKDVLTEEGVEWCQIWNFDGSNDQSAEGNYLVDLSMPGEDNLGEYTPL